MIQTQCRTRHLPDRCFRGHFLLTRVCLIATFGFVGALAPGNLAADDLQSPPTSESGALTPEQEKFFESKIRPVLIKECYGCHSNKAGNVRGGLRLDTQALTHIGGSSGPAIVPGDVEESLLYNAINHEDWVMPPNRKLSQEVINDFRDWILMGAPDPRVTKVAEVQSSITEDDIEEAKSTFWAYQKPRAHEPPLTNDSTWAKTDIDQFILSKLEAHGVAPAEDAASHTVLRRLCFDLVGLPPTPQQLEAFNRAWNRDPDAAIEEAVEQLIAQEQFGERWGRHWLDVARYAESTGREVNTTYPHAWRYRDYVIDAFNSDKPFNEFVQEQIAGDLLPVESDEEWSEHLVATTFLAMGSKNLNEQNRIQFAMDQVDEQIDATTRVFMGMSVACARCHDHKFDAIPQTDYYALAGVFANMTTYYGNPPSKYGTVPLPQRRQVSSLIRLPIQDETPIGKSYSAEEIQQLEEQMIDLRQELSQLRGRDEQSGGNALQARLRILNQMATVSDKLAVVDSDGTPISYTMGVQERKQPRDARFLVRGEIDQAGELVPRGFPQVLCHDPVSIEGKESGRLQLARWIGSDENSLTARVMVNRVWKHLIGQGIVTSTENFGVTGSAPSHPELLDYLAIRFVESGWSVKTLVREITRSRVYRIASEYRADYHELDPDNALVWRANPKRLEAEAIRDAMLSISGELDLGRPLGSFVAEAGYVRVRNGVLGDPRESMRAMAGQAARAAMAEAASEMRQSMLQSRRGRFGGQRANRQPMTDQQNSGQRSNSPRNLGRRDIGLSVGESMRERVIANALSQAEKQLDREDANYRSVYLPVVRDELPRSLEVFDFADASTVTGVRETSSTANQALYMLNNAFVMNQSAEFARRLAETSTNSRQRLDQAFLLAFGRSPTLQERSAASEFVRTFSRVDGNRGDSGEVLQAFCQSLFASAEFRIID